MRRLLAAAIVFGFLMTGFVGMVSAVSTEGNATGRPMATADGLYWQDDKRLTNNGADDGYPTLAVDSFGYSHIMWYRTGTHMYKKIDRYGNEIFTEKTIVSANLPTQHCLQPTERVGIDSQENFHVVWCTQSLWGPMYQKFSSSGNPLCQPINLAPMASSPHVVGIAVGKNNRGYFCYENEGSERIEMAYVDNNFNLHTGYLSTTSGEGVTIGLDKKDQVHIFSKSWSSTGMYHTKFSPEGQVLTPPHKVDTPVSGSGWDSPLPSLAFGSDGAIHVLQASKANGVKALYYTKLDNEGNKLTSDIVVTQNANDYGDICVDGKRNVYAIWGDASDGELYYCRFQANQENATIVPVKLTQSSGIDKDPKIRVDPDDSLHVTWQSDRDGNKEVYYKFAFSYGVELTMPPEEMAKIMYVHPNETKSANVTVRNMGGQNDTMYLGVNAEFYEKEGGVGKDYKGGGWKTWMDENKKEMEMAAQEIRKVPIYVRGPSKGSPNEYITIIMNATSKMNPLKNDTISFRVYLVVDHRILVKCADHVHTTSAAVPTTYMIQVANIGDIDEIVNITLSGPPGWDFYVDLWEVVLKPSANAMVTLTVTPPADAQADEVGIVTVQGHSKAEPSVKDQAATHTVVTPFMYIQITCEKPEEYVDPGNSTAFTLQVANFGNVAGTVIIILEIVSGSGDWVATLDSNAVGVAGGETKNVILTVVAPANAVASSRLVVRVQGYNAEKTISADCLTTTIVKQVHNIQVATTPEMVAVFPGEKANYQVTITNQGNGAEDVKLGAAELPVGWDITYERQGGAVINEVESILLEPGSSLTFNAILSVAPGALAMDYKLKGRILDRDGNTYPIDVTTRVNQVYDIDITTTLSKQTGVPGAKVIFTLIGKNKGNGFDTLTFETSGMPRDWTGAEFRDVNYERNNQLSLNASGIERMSLVIPIPSNTNATSAEFFVTAKSEGGTTDSVKLVVDIKMANLLVKKIVYTPKTLKANKVATIVVTLDNEGEVTVENVTVRFYEDKTIVGTERLEIVSGGSNRTVTFTWLAKAGPHTLKFVVDPDNLIVESNKKDNTAKENVKVGGGGWNDMPGFEMPFLVLALGAAAAVMVARRKK